MTTFRPLTDDEKTTILRLYVEEKKSRNEIASMVNRSYESVCWVVRDVPDNGTRGLKSGGGWGKQKDAGWPVPDTTIEVALKGGRYDDANIAPQGFRIPLNGDALKFAAQMRGCSYGVSESL